jgi:NADH dehydrogenase
MHLSDRHKVVIVGGGFGGLAAARALRRAPVDVTLVDRRNYHLFQPLLYQVATGELSPANIASPLRGILRKQKNCRVMMDEVNAFDVQKKVVHATGVSLPYDSLIIATGARHSYFGRDDWEASAPGLKSIEDATEIRKRILFAFEAAERADHAEDVKSWLTFVIVGAGPTGVEMAGAISEIAHHTLKRDFRKINPSDAHIILVEAAPHPLGVYPEELSAKARKSLERLQVAVRTHTKVTNVADDAVEVESGGAVERIPTHTVIWAAGVAASPLGRKLSEATGCALDRAGRVVVSPDLSVAGHPDVFVIGDLASYSHHDGKPLPGLAPVAMQQGKFVARLIEDRLRGRTTKPFHYIDRGSMAVIGRYAAVALIGKRQFAGFRAWLIWVFIHLMQITQFRNRLLVLMQWGWSFFTRDRAARLITHYQETAPDEQPDAKVP